MLMEFTQEMLLNGLLSGLIATVVMTVFMMIGKATGMAPMDLLLMMGRKILGSEAVEKKTRMFGMLQHLIVGTVWGIVYIAAVGNQLYFTELSIRSGLLFALIPWLIMMLVMMPMMGVGVFGLKKSPRVLVLTLLLHLIYGGTLGYIASVL